VGGEGGKQQRLLPLTWSESTGGSSWTQNLTKIDSETKLGVSRINAFEYYRHPGMIVKYFKIHIDFKLGRVVCCPCSGVSVQFGFFPSLLW
jgi:hypothetical protein